MENYLFIRKNNQEGQEPILVVSSELFETMKMSDAYGDYGQQITAEDAGDSIELLTEKAVKIANEAYNDFHNYEGEDLVQKWSVDDVINAYDYSLEGFDAVVENEDLKEDIDYEYDGMEVKGHTFWDGHNWKTITIEQDIYEPTHEVITDKELVKELQEAIENKEFKKDGFGQTIYEFGQWCIISSQYQGSFESFAITEIE